MYKLRKRDVIAKPSRLGAATDVEMSALDDETTHQRCKTPPPIEDELPLQHFLARNLMKNEMAFICALGLGQLRQQLNQALKSVFLNQLQVKTATFVAPASSQIISHLFSGQTNVTNKRILLADFNRLAGELGVEMPIIIRKRNVEALLVGDVSLRVRRLIVFPPKDSLVVTFSYRSQYVTGATAVAAVGMNTENVCFFLINFLIIFFYTKLLLIILGQER